MIMTFFSVLRISLVAVKPSIPGIIMSMRIRSNGGSSCTFLIASDPFGWNLVSNTLDIAVANLLHQQRSTRECWQFLHQNRSIRRHRPRPGYVAV
jgi:hypothetical protein